MKIKKEARRQTGHGEKMKTNLNRIGIKDLNIFNGLSPSSSIELLRIVFKSGGASAYLPHDVIRFLNLGRESKSLVAFLDDTGPYNFLVVTSDKNLVELLKPLILQKRQRTEQLQEKLKAQLQSEKEVEAETVDV